MAHRTPRELIEIYWDRVYNNGEVELVREVCANPIIRHDPRFVTALDHDEQIVRVKRSVVLKPHFTHRVLHADDRFVTSVWNMTSALKPDLILCGIEVFEAEDGRFIRCWNSNYAKGPWGEDGDEFDPATLTAPPLARTPAELSASWLERALAAGGVVTPQRLAMEPEVTPIGHGTTSDVVRLRASYNSGHVTAPTSVICKIGQQQGESGPFTRELRAYQLFGPDPAFRTPRFYFGGIDESGLSNILLEDLSASAHAGDQIAGCSIAEAEAVVRELALFHRGFWNNPAIASLDWLSDPQRLLPAFQRGTEVLRQWLGQRIPAGDFDIITGFRERAERWLDMASPHVTLVHNDPRVDNILFEDRDGQTRACLIDWQSLGRGDPQSDVAYFLSGSLTPEDRRRCERDLVAAHAALIAETDSGYTTELALESYRRNIGSGLWMTAIAAAHVKQTDHNALLLETLVSRNTAAIRDWDGLSAIA